MSGLGDGVSAANVVMDLQVVFEVVAHDGKFLFGDLPVAAKLVGALVESVRALPDLIELAAVLPELRALLAIGDYGADEFSGEPKQCECEQETGDDNAGNLGSRMQVSHRTGGKCVDGVHERSSSSICW
jgi:hypothetical protein